MEGKYTGDLPRVKRRHRMLSGILLHLQIPYAACQSVNFWNAAVVHERRIVSMDFEMTIQKTEHKSLKVRRSTTVSMLPGQVPRWNRSRGARPNKNERSSIKNKSTFVYFVVSCVRFKTREIQARFAPQRGPEGKRPAEPSIVPSRPVFLFAAICENF